MTFDSLVQQSQADEAISTSFLDNVHRQYHAFCKKHFGPPASFVLIASSKYLYGLEVAMAASKTIIRLADNSMFAATCGALRFYLGAEITVKIVAVNDKSMEPVIVFGTATKVE